MAQPKRIFLIASFNYTNSQSIRIERRRWIKGFIRIGHDVQCFSYKDVMIQLSPIKSSRVIKRVGKKRADKALIEQIKTYHPDIVMILAMKHLDSETIAQMRKAAPNAVFISRDVDWWPERYKNRMQIARQMDIVVATNAGSFLQSYKDAGVPLSAFIPCPCDPDIQRPYSVDEKLKTDIIFLGKAKHGKNDNSDDRYSLVKKLSELPNAKVYGDFGTPTIDGIDCFRAISNAKIALSINSINSVRLYHSDRFISCLSCGTFTLAKRVPDTELLFKDGIHLKYFDTAEEFFELANYYLKNETEREKIAIAGMQRAHNEFNCEKMAQYVIDLVEKGNYDVNWAEIR